MQLPIVFFQVTVMLLLLGVLASRGLVAKDWLFTSYLAFFLASTASLWVFVQSTSAAVARQATAEELLRLARTHETTYIALYGVALILAIAIVARYSQAWFSLLIGLVCAAACFWIGWDVFPRGTTFAAASCFIHLACALCVLIESFHAEPGFEVIELRGLGFFWVAQLGASALYVVGVLRGQQPQIFTTNVAASLGAMAVLWMALSIWFGGAASWSGVSAEESKGDDRGDWLELQGEFARGKAKNATRV